MSKRRVVITGLGAVTPVGLNVKETWNNILSGMRSWWRLDLDIMTDCLRVWRGHPISPFAPLLRSARKALANDGTRSWPCQYERARPAPRASGACKRARMLAIVRFGRHGRRVRAQSARGAGRGECGTDARGVSPSRTAGASGQARWKPRRVRDGCRGVRGFEKRC